MNYKSALGFCAAAALLLQYSTANAAMINNGPPGPGHFQVDSLNGGDANYAAYNPGTGLTDLLYSLNHYIDVGANGSAVDLGGTVTTSATPFGPNVLSAGNFAGQNATINWTAVASVLPSTSTYSVSYLFTSATAFGSLRFIQYMDADIVGAGGDNLIVLGTSGQPGFQLLTVDSGANTLGLAQSADFVNATGMNYVGWAARPYSSLLSAITGLGGASYSIPGVVSGLPSTTDSRFPGSPAFGTGDVTSAIAFDLNPTASTATVTFTVSASNVPEPGTWTLVVGGALLIGLGRWKR